MFFALILGLSFSFQASATEARQASGTGMITFKKEFKGADSNDAVFFQAGQYFDWKTSEKLDRNKFYCNYVGPDAKPKDILPIRSVRIYVRKALTDNSDWLSKGISSVNLSVYRDDQNWGWVECHLQSNKQDTLTLEDIEAAFSGYASFKFDLLNNMPKEFLNLSKTEKLTFQTTEDVVLPDYSKTNGDVLVLKDGKQESINGTYPDFPLVVPNYNTQYLRVPKGTTLPVLAFETEVVHGYHPYENEYVRTIVWLDLPFFKDDVFYNDTMTLTLHRKNTFVEGSLEDLTHEISPIFKVMN